MHAVALFLTLAVVAVDPEINVDEDVQHGWQRNKQGEIEYIIQISPKMAEHLSAPPPTGQLPKDLLCEIPESMGQVNKVLIRIGTGPVPRTGLDPSRTANQNPTLPLNNGTKPIGAGIYKPNINAANTPLANDRTPLNNGVGAFPNPNARGATGTTGATNTGLNRGTPLVDDRDDRSKTPISELETPPAKNGVGGFSDVGTQPFEDRSTNPRPFTKNDGVGTGEYSRNNTGIVPPLVNDKYGDKYGTAGAGGRYTNTPTDTYNDPRDNTGSRYTGVDNRRDPIDPRAAAPSGYGNQPPYNQPPIRDPDNYTGYGQQPNGYNNNYAQQPPRQPNYGQNPNPNNVVLNPPANNNFPPNNNVAATNPPLANNPAITQGTTTTPNNPAVNTTNTSNKPLTTRDNGRYDDGNSPTMVLTIVAMLLFCSIGLNFYLGWIAQGVYQRYRALLMEVRNVRAATI